MSTKKKTGTTKKPQQKKVKGKNVENTSKKTIDYEKKLMTIVENGKEKNIPLNNKQIAEILYGKKLLIRGKNKKQKEMLREIDKNQITFAIGPAGTGKSFISTAKALELLANPNNNYQKIYIITPAVTADEDVGYLSGSLTEKIFPFLFSTYYIMDKIIGKQNRKQLQELKIVSPLSYGYLRGLNIDNSIVICEESQNTTSSQMKLLLTRIGFQSRFIVNGDVEQTDSKIKNPGLQDAIDRFSSMDEIGYVKFKESDIVRNPLITKILERYN